MAMFRVSDRRTKLALNIFSLKKLFFFSSVPQKSHTLGDVNSSTSSTRIFSLGISQNLSKFSISAQPFTDSTAAMFENLPFSGLPLTDWHFKWILLSAPRLKHRKQRKSKQSRVKGKFWKNQYNVENDTRRRNRNKTFVKTNDKR